MRSTVGVALKWVAGAASSLVFLLQGMAVTQAAGVDCMDTSAALEYWRPVREQATTSEAPADALAVELLSCLGSPDKELRDRIAYELLTYWLRGEMLGDDTRKTLLDDLSAMIAVPPAATPDDSALQRSFSALILSELMRSDANKPFMSATQRQALLTQAIQSLQHENDYRGLDPELGWVHPVAHMSDLLWRFALHPETSPTETESILAGVRSKVAPTGIFYGFNESDRLARVITTIIQRKLVGTNQITSWIEGFGTPVSIDKWSDAFASPRGMAELHNTKLFLRALSDQLNGTEIDPVIARPLETLVQGLTQLI